jgi:hypothetical protein
VSRVHSHALPSVRRAAEGRRLYPLTMAICATAGEAERPKAWLGPIDTHDETARRADH